MDDPITLAAMQQRFLTHHRARNHSPRQIEHYERTFLDFDRYLESAGIPPLATALTTATIEGFCVWLRETPIRPYRGSTQRSENGIRGHLKDMKSFVRWCSRPQQGFVTWEVEIALPVAPKELYKIFADDELVRLFAAPMMTGESEYAIRNRALVAILLDTGIRLAEAAALTPNSIKGRRFLEIFGKGSRERLVPIHSTTLAYLDAWLEVRQRLDCGPDDALFDLRYHGIKNLLRRLSAVVGFRANPHKFRHQAATMFLRASGDIYAVKDLLGHSSVLTTSIYLTMTKEDLAAKHDTGSPMAAVAAMLPAPPIERKPRRVRR